MTEHSNKWFLERALQTAEDMTPKGRQLVIQPFHQSIYFNSRPALNPDGTWEFRAEFRYIPLGAVIPDGWFSLPQVRESLRR